MLSEHRPLAGEVIAFLGPLNVSGFEKTHLNEIDYLSDLAREAGARVQSQIDPSVTLLVTSELSKAEAIEGLSTDARIISEAIFMDRYLTEVMTGEEWE